MVKVTKKNNYTFDDCCKNEFEFKDNDLIVDFYQGGNRDLYFTCFPREEKKENILNIKALDNYTLYKLVDDLYNDITDLSRWEYPTSDMKNCQSKLFNGEYISWESDDYCEIGEADDKKKYNYLNIYKSVDEYIFKFINNSDRSIFSIAINTDRSKYRMFAYAFSTFLHNLGKVTDEYQQISIEEYLEVKRLIKKYEGDKHGQ